MKYAKQLNRPCGAQRYQPTQQDDRDEEISGRNGDERNDESGIPVTVLFFVRTDG
jgi:hypothetical protein